MTQALNALYPLNKENFKAFLGESFRLRNLGLASNAPIANLNEFDFLNSIIYATNADREQFLKPSEYTAHKNLAFSLVEIDSHKKANLIKATRAINRAIPSYNIIFFLSPTHLSIAFAKRRLHKSRTIHTDIVEKITLIKDIDLAHPSQAHTRNLQSIAKITPKEVDNYYGEILEALSISALNKEFYAKILVHFADFVENLTLPNISPSPADGDKGGGYDTTQKREFILRLFSRILFCKFLEKKGIIKANLWDTSLSADYYHEVLEPLFFTTLNTPQDSRDYGFLPPQIVEILSTIPYLNGGLFSPQTSDYFIPSNPHTHANTLKIDNALFDRLFATLDSYHFTIDEADESAEEVALDPELLGQIFESLLSQLFTDNKLDKLDKNSLRKSTGSYYTPSEIVRYMVRSAILLHLQTHLKGKVDSAYLQSLVFEDFAHSPSFAEGDKGGGYDFAKSTPNFCHTEGEARSIQKDSIYSQRGSIFDEKSGLCSHERGNKTKASIDEASGKLHDLSQKDNALILATLSTLKILDPACGSGAFPMGILSEIIRLQDLLGDLRPYYARKLEILQSCIYGIDIQPMATEIARLRCFLSLIVDENPSDIKSLPNLEFKFISANSLLPLQTELRDSKGRQLGSDLYESGLDELRQIRLDTFTSHDKDALQSRYQATCDKISQSLFFEAEGDTPLTKWKPFNPHNVADFFDSTYMFGVESFDIVIGNPPYIRGQNIPNKEAISKSYVGFACGSADIYTYFFAKGFGLLKQKGTLSYIVSNKFTKASYGQNLRNLILQNQIVFYVDCDGVKIFDNAKVDSCIISISKTKPIHTFSYSKVASLQNFANDIYTNIQKIPQQNLNPKFFSFEPQSKSTDLVQKIKSFELKFSQIAQIAKGSSSGNDDVFLFDFVLESKKLYKVKNDFGEFELEKDLLQPFVYGENIRRYEYCKYATYILYPYDNQNALIKSNTMSKKYPLIYQYLQDRKSLLMQRKIKLNDDDFYKFSAIRNPHTYNKPKVMIPDLLNHSRFGFDNVGFYHNASIHNVYLKQGYKNLEKMILGVLNSRLFWFFIRHSSANLGSATRLMPSYLNDFSFPKIDSNNQDLADEIGSLVDRTLESKSQNKDTNEFEKQIDDLVYELYNLTFDEVKIIKS
ncbi:Eco57I restriction-modification methylase domain-containing protein [Helicobacter macacae]|uniref:site-specific DNA-methyltransferase (adenine-specific) n=1 Tax=Helicobacter macacae MIT 99-5501 TaxID=1357400 RepID=V8C5V2_9HELI|nr:Eco57I restriction-modification methylase domain-containing protein [Helicobacter macacae]ETD22744.1 hypothetical protein HMPREF2086_01543 [Helicobacter macacae MIT 99-5501]